MKLKFAIPVIALIMFLCLPSSGFARMIHDFDCENCHKAGMDLTSVSGIVCLDCHNSTQAGNTFPLNRMGPGPTNPISDETFAVGDASDALGSVTSQGETPNQQTSHNWAAPLENSAAGARNPSNSRFYGRQNSSGTHITCSRCHDPHGSNVATRSGPPNPKLLKLGADSEISMCNDCHSDWANEKAPSESGSTPLNLHPMVNNYAAIAADKPTEYNSVTDLDNSAGEVALNAAGGIDCLTCHGVHFTDSDASSLDGVQGGSLAHLNTSGRSVGKILRANGPEFDKPNIAGESICQSCHKYSGHGSTQVIGCTICHSAHLEANGTMNHYMLRSEITTYLPKDAANGTVTNLVLDVADDPKQRLYDYCFTCHDVADAVAGHVPTWDCQACHEHSDTDGSWTAAGGCNTCHGYPPIEDTASDNAGGNAGYAVGYDGEAHFKDETATLHNLHAGSIEYSFSCSSCHAGNGHIDGNFADVFLSASNRIYNGNGLLTGGNAPAYASAGAGSCSSVYCHSNGGPRTAVDNVRATPTVSAPLTWESGTVTGDCDVCHGNDATDMGTLNNSATHIAHLDKGYSCQVCHSATADSDSALASGAVGGTHVDGDADVSFDATSLGFGLGTTSYGLTDGTCSVYCHSNGTTNVSPDWDVAGSGACGTCHQYSNSGVATGSGAALGGAHAAHLYGADSPQLACTVCHTHTGATGAANTAHVDGSVNLVTNYMDNVCNPCHGSVDSGTGDDAEPNWTVASSVSCQTCHAGTVIATIDGNGGAGSYVDKRAYPSYGHGDSGLSFEGTYGASSSSCEGCHDASAAGHLNGNNDPRLKDQNTQAYADDNNAWCQECHSGLTPHFSTSGASTAATLCATCHDPHGQSGNTQDAMIVNSIGGKPVSGFADKDVAGSYFAAVANGSSEYEGICQVCHIGPDVAHYTRTAAPDGHNDSSKCISCHTHTTTPEAFKASCDGCHGDGSGEYWPQNAGNITATANLQTDFNDNGRHSKHLDVLAAKFYSESLAQLITDTGNGTADEKQRTLCSVCHDLSDVDHAAAGSRADVFRSNAKQYWQADPAVAGADADASFAVGSGTCATTDCHNNKTTTTTGPNDYSWYGSDTSGCIMCHDNVTTAGTHDAHMSATGTYGLTTACTDCHTASTAWGTAPDSGHWDGAWTISGSGISSYDGDWATSAPGTCGTNDCHNDGSGSQPADNTYTWGTAEASACGICHLAIPDTNDHEVHLNVTGSGPQYGPRMGTNCSGCHLANANNTSMASMSTHLNGTVTFNNVAVSASPYEVASGQIGAVANNAVDSCDLCHGGNTAANTAKDYWTTADRVSCESCHGQYAAAEIAGVAAPIRADAKYYSFGHGRTSGDNPPNASCENCHGENLAHISGSLNDANRVPFLSLSRDYNDPTKRNAYCNFCHFEIGEVNVHFNNDNTSGGTSTPALYCVSCHEPHGQGGQDAMIKASAGGTTTAPGGQTVTGFTDRTDRASYSNDSFTGICQTCHDTEVTLFNRSTDSKTTHNPLGGNCLSCHSHKATPAFKVSCDSCHGDDSGEYWPQNAGNNTTTDNVRTDFNDNGRHQQHIEVLAAKVYSESTAQLKTDTGNGTADEKQKTLCSYCHDLSDTDHASTGGDADVFRSNAKQYWQADPNTAGADANATYNAGADTCATTDCHNNKLTADGTYGWYDGGTSNCVMCHVDVTDSGTPSHTLHTGAPYSIGCDECHVGSPVWVNAATQTAPSGGTHMNGSFTVGDGNRTITYNSGTGSCGTNECHNNGNMGAPNASGYDWSAGNVAGGCTECHDASINTNNHDTHRLASAAANGTEHFISSMTCRSCHTHSVTIGSAENHLSGSIEFKAGISYSASVAINDGGVFGTCNTSLCHTDGRGSNVITPGWDRAAATVDDCTLCHADSSTSMSNSHDAHVGSPQVTSYVAAGSNQSTAGEYAFDCQLCHGNTVANHIDGDADLLGGMNWNGGSNTCSTNSCHHDGQGGPPKENPDWVNGFGPGDPCAKCHANSPDATIAHAAHEVGFHYKEIYSGLTGFLPTNDNDCDPGAGTGNCDGGLAANWDRIRGHGGLLSDDTTATSTVMTCSVCHWSTVTVHYNANNTTCVTCHTAVSNPDNNDKLVGNAAMEITDKSVHVDGNRDVVFFPQQVKSKAQLRDENNYPIVVNTSYNGWTDVVELSFNWGRVNGYKNPDGSSYDEQSDALNNLSVWNAAEKTCVSSCHLWEDGRVDKVEVDWIDNATGQPAALMCIDCHSRLPK